MALRAVVALNSLLIKKLRGFLVVRHVTVNYNINPWLTSNTARDCVKFSVRSVFVIVNFGRPQKLTYNTD